jgi:hypothetical protein
MSIRVFSGAFNEYMPWWLNNTGATQALRPYAYLTSNTRVSGRVLGILKYPDTYSFNVELSTLVPAIRYLLKHAIWPYLPTWYLPEYLSRNLPTTWYRCKAWCYPKIQREIKLNALLNNSQNSNRTTSTKRRGQDNASTNGAACGKNQLENTKNTNRSRATGPRHPANATTTVDRSKLTGGKSHEIPNFISNFDSSSGKACDFGSVGSSGPLLTPKVVPNCSRRGDLKNLGGATWWEALHLTI